MNEPNGSQRDRFEALATPLAGPLYGYALRLVRRPDRAADLVQETFLRAYRTFGNFRPETNAKAWLFRILYTVHLNEVDRERRRPPTTSVDGAFEDGPLEIADWSGTREILTNPAIDWNGSEVEREVAALPDEFRQTVLLVDLGDLSYQEAADVLGCPVGTVRSRLARARRRLAERLRHVARDRGLAEG